MKADHFLDQRAAGMFWGAAVVLMAYCIKKYYATADSESLFWILIPTARLVELISGIGFYHKPGVGWINDFHEVIIAPSCGGVNFFIILFCMGSFQVIFISGSRSLMLGGVFVAAAGAYTMALIVNSLRIWLSIFLYQAEIYSCSITPELIHRIAGVCVYYLFLYFYYCTVSFILKRCETDSSLRRENGSGIARVLTGVVPLLWYLAFSLGVPLLNSADQKNPERFSGHFSVVRGTSVLISGVLLVTAGGYRRVISFYRKKGTG